MNIHVSILNAIKSYLVNDDWIKNNMDDPSQDIYIYDRIKPALHYPCIDIMFGESTHEVKGSGSLKHTASVFIYAKIKVFDSEKMTLGTGTDPADDPVGILEFYNKILDVYRQRAQLDLGNTVEYFFPKRSKVGVGIFSYPNTALVEFLQVAETEFEIVYRDLIT